MEGFVYLWTNKINGKKYIGSHIGTPDDGYTGSGAAFRRALNKYGIENFERTILEEVQSKDEVKTREQFYLDTFGAAKSKEFYNLSPHAGGGWDFVNSNPESRKKSNAAAKDRWKRRPHPKGMKGKTHTPEVRARIKKSSKEAIRYKRAVEQLDLDGNLIRTFESLADAAIAMGAKNCSNIKYTCEGKWQKMYGYKWRYVEVSEVFEHQGLF